MDAIELVHSYDPVLFLGSIAIAGFGGYVALWLIGRVRVEQNRDLEFRWLAAASAVMGVGIWSMHFTGMLALRLPVSVGYEPVLTLLSVAIAVVVSLLALGVVRRERVTTAQLAGAATLMGGAIAGMHYTGMAAMRLPGTMFYRSGLVAASVAVGVAASGAALWLFLRHRDRPGPVSTLLGGRLIGGVTLGFAVSGLHYTAMAAARFRDLRPEAGLPTGEFLLSEGLALWVGVGSLLLLGLGLVAALVDRRLHLAYAEDLRESRRRYETLLTEISDTVTVLDEDGTILYQSPSVEHVFGYEVGERTDRSAFEMVHPDDLDEVREAFRRSVSRDEGTTVQYRLRHADGTWRRVESTAVMPKDEELGAMVVVTRDITDRVTAQRKYQTIFDTTPSAVGISSLADGRFIDVNPAFEDLLGFSRDEVIEATSGELGVWAREEEREGVVGELRQTGTVHNREVQFRDADGNLVDVLFSGAVIELDDRSSFLGVAKDITERKEFEKALEHQALHDRLTGLPNRALFSDRLAHALDRVQRDGEEQVGVLFIDLDRFKTINDSLGHVAGDRVLQRVADRLEETLREEDTVARVGGDEFAVLLEGLSSEADIERAMSRIRRAFETPFEVEGTSFSLDGSIGIAHTGLGFTGAEELIRLADAAMYRVKGGGATSYHVFDSDEDREVTVRLQRETALQRAVDEREFVVHYQPIHRLDSREIVGAEALVRWDHPERGLLPPAEFVPLAEETGLIGPLGDQVLTEALRQYRRWRERSLVAEGDFRLSVNTSARQHEDPEFADRLEAATREAGVSLSALCLEVTETVAMTGPSRLEPLHDRGLKIAVDDFGTGYSTLEYLSHFPADEIKIDRSFIARLGAPDRTSKLVQGILDMTRSMALGVVAEGVETERQVALLREFGCRHGQGYLFTRPMPAPELEGLLRRKVA